MSNVGLTWVLLSSGRRNSPLSIGQQRSRAIQICPRLWFCGIIGVVSLFESITDNNNREITLHDWLCWAGLLSIAPYAILHETKYMYSAVHWTITVVCLTDMYPNPANHVKSVLWVAYLPLLGYFFRSYLISCHWRLSHVRIIDTLYPNPDACPIEELYL